MRIPILIAALVIPGCAAKSSAPVAVGAAEHRVQVCLVDTLVPGGMMTVSAIHVVATNDTLVLQANGRVPIQQVAAGPQTWRGGPIQLLTASGRVRFNASGQPRVFAPGKIVLLGVLNGLPVFGNPGDVGAMRAELEALAASGVDLDQALEKRLSLRRQMNRVRTIYLPTSLVNCTFQTLTRPAPTRR